MKLAIVRQRYNPYGGAERFIERAVKALRADGAAVSVIAREWPSAPAGAAATDEREAAAGVAASAIVCDPFYIGRLWRDIGFAHAVCARLRGERFDLVQSHERLACCDIFRAGDGVHRQWLENRGRTQSALARTATRLHPFHLYLLRAERRLFASPRLRAVICNSRMVRDDVVRHFGVDAARLEVIYNGVDLAQFHPGLRDEYRAATRARLSIGADDIAYLFVGSGFARKGVDALLRAFAAAAGPSARLIVVGADKRAHAARALADRLGCGARVSFTGGVADVRPYYAAADCFVLPTLYDPLPNAALEALACGVPVITSRQCGAAELLTPGVNGLVCDAFDPADVAAVLGRAPQVIGEHARFAARQAVEHLSIEAMSGRLRGLYARLMAARMPVQSRL
jgi:UDP-glucose:(heptosyl)LPS alpha-1,3-glucosyltransferase